MIHATLSLIGHTTIACEHEQKARVPPIYKYTERHSDIGCVLIGQDLAKISVVQIALFTCFLGGGSWANLLHSNAPN